MRLIVPPLEKRPWPTLGPEVCDFIEDYLVHGPGDVLGERVALTDELRLVFYRAYEVYPRDHEQAGRRRFKLVGLSRRKGWSKTEAAAWTAIIEAHPEGPVRCDGWKKEGRTWVPVGRPVRDPYIPMVATTEEQTDDLAYGAVHAILTQDSCPIAGDFDVGLERTQVIRGGSGEIKPLASAPSARDGARTTFQHFDETHLFTTDRLRTSYRTMQRNIPKRKGADAWSLETTTAYAPGEGSVAEDSHHYAEQVLAGEIEDPRLYFDHLQASESHDITNDEGLQAFVVEASGDAIGFTDVPTIMAHIRNPKVPESESRRFWGNQPRGSANRWIPPKAWAEAGPDPEEPLEAVEMGTEIALGFWGGVNRDSAGLVGATRDGRLFVIGWWEPAAGMRITDDEVETVLTHAAKQWKPFELVTSRVGGSGWIDEIDEWATSGAYGTVVEIPINSPARMGPACDRLYNAIHDQTVRHDGNPALARHVASCVPAQSNWGTYIRPAPGEHQHIDLARAAVLAFERAAVPAAPKRKPMILVGRSR